MFGTNVFFFSEIVENSVPVNGPYRVLPLGFGCWMGNFDIISMEIL